MSGVTSTAAGFAKAPRIHDEVYVSEHGSDVAAEMSRNVERIARPAARRWSSPKSSDALGVIHLKDIVKGGMKRALQHSCARWAFKTVMITGDNPLTAAAIAREAGVDDFLARRRRKTRWI